MFTLPAPAVMVVSAVVPLTYILAVGLLTKRVTVLEFVVNGLLFVVCVGAAQWILGKIKANVYPFAYLYPNAVTGVLWSLDSWMYYFLYLKVVKSLVQNVLGKSRILARLVYPLVQRGAGQQPDSGEYGAPEQCTLVALRTREEKTRKILDGAKNPKLARRLYGSAIALYNVGVLASVLVVGKLNNALVEIIVIGVVFWIGRVVLVDCWHSQAKLWCFVAANFAFYCLGKITPPLHVSIFCSVILGCMLAYAMAEFRIIGRNKRFAEENDPEEVKKHREFFQRHHNFDPDRCTPEMMRERCAMIGLDLETTEYCVRLFCVKAPQKEVAAERFTTANAISVQKSRYRKKLLMLPE
jgi:hypothetical protein